jgi:hypothetical protein
MMPILPNRLKQVRGQAEAYISTIYASANLPVTNSTSFHELVDLRVAELIIRECAEFIDREEQPVCGSTLLEHFGLK